MTARDISKHYGYTTSRVHQIARARGIKPYRVEFGGHVWYKRDLPKFRRRPAGRPKGAK